MFLLADSNVYYLSFFMNTDPGSCCDAHSKVIIVDYMREGYNHFSMSLSFEFYGYWESIDWQFADFKLFICFKNKKSLVLTMIVCMIFFSASISLNSTFFGLPLFSV